MLDEEKPLIAGVYANRLDPKKWPLGAAPVGPDDLLRPRLARARQGRPSTSWPTYVFWAPIKGGLTDETAAGRPGRLQHLHQQGPAAGPDRHADPDLDRRRARARHEGRLPVLPGQGRRQRARRRSPRRSRSTRPTSRSTSSPRREPARRGRAAWPVPADFAPPPSAADRDRLGRGRIGPRGRPGSHACGPGSRRPASTPTSASGASTCAT